MPHGGYRWHLWLLLTYCLLLKTSATRGSHSAVHLPIRYGRHRTQHFRRAIDGQVAVGGLGDYEDIAYSVLVKLGSTTVPLLVDTGSSDLWAISDSCAKNCSQGLPTIPHKRLNYSGVDARLFYGDSFNGQYAFGPIGSATVQIANLSIGGQFFAAINDTDTTTISTLSVGLLGLGFPESSAIWNTLFNHQYPTSSKTSSTITTSTHSTTTAASTSKGATHVAARSIPRTSRLFDVAKGMQSLATVDQLLKTFITYGPLVARMSFSGLLRTPSFSVTLQRDTVDVGGNAGLLSLGELPPGVSNASLTWTRVRQYTVQQGGIPPSPAAPNETYSLFWEIPIDNVYLDGSALPASTLSTGVSLSALIDTGSSLLRGPADVVADIYKQISGDETSSTYDCSQAHVLEFEISGTKFPVDPRDFGWQAYPDSLQRCNASVVATDPPSKGFLYAWQLGVPFLKSVLASFYYGNLTNPSVDPPRIGLVSTMPSNAKVLLADALKAAGANFPAIIEHAPASIPNLTASGIAGVALAPTHNLPSSTVSTASTTSSTSSSQSLGSSTSSPAPTTSVNTASLMYQARQAPLVPALILGLYMCFG